MMNTTFDVTLTGSDTPVEGIASAIVYEGQNAYEFKSLDETLHLVIARDTYGHWQRVAGTYPYLTGWVDELAEQLTV